ncbi:hypothetical protein [Chryseobacterium indologenes]|uniref:hypothetical protein n=1 Tax=Chryseobacterium indologenes TaxID=253 RepID=UPI000786C59B|nr:hypothetical protein [Chryseobacterium indologenes]
MGRKKKVEENTGRTPDGKFAAGNKISVGNEGGIESKYKPEYSEQAYNYCLLGATDKQLAEFFDVCEATINNWKKDYPEFLEALRAGKEVADIMVAKSLYQNCMGAITTTQKEVRIKQVDPKTKKLIDKVEIVTLQDQLPPDTNAIKFWLTNRQKSMWSIKNETKVSGDPENPIAVTQITGMVVK